MHVLKTGNLSYFLLTGLGFLIAITASVNQFTGNSVCPKTISGIALCYYSLAIFSALLIIKRILIKNDSEDYQNDF